MLARLGSGGGGLYGGNPWGLGPKSGHMKEEGRAGAVGGGLRNRSRRSSGEGSRTSRELLVSFGMSSVEESPHPF